MKYLVIRYFCFENGRRGWVKLTPLGLSRKKFTHDLVDLSDANRYDDTAIGFKEAKEDLDKFVELTELPLENFEINRVTLSFEKVQ